MSRLFSIVLALVALPALAQGEAAEKLKLTVVPFASVGADVPQRAGSKAAGMLTQEFKNAEGLQVVEAKKSESTDPFEGPLADARKSVEEAKALRAKKKFRLADEALHQAIKSYQAAAAGLTDVSEVVDAWALLSAVQYNTGRDDDGKQSLTQALSLSPDRVLPLAQTSPLFSRVVEDLRKSVKAAPTGTLVLESSPAGAPVLVDGVALGSTPLSVTAVPPGEHAWRAQLPNGEVVGGMVSVAAGKTTKVAASSVNKDPELRLLTAVAANRLDPDAVAAAKEHALAAQADYVVFGGLSKDGKGLALDAFLFVAKSGELRRLSRAKFDPELLSAGMEFYNLVGELSKAGAQVGSPVKVPSAVAGDVAGGGVKVAEAKYGQLPKKALTLDVIDDPTTVTPGKTDDKSNKRRVPLRRK